MKRWIALLLLVTTFASASHLSNLMHRYKRAPESQKYRIMNQIKLEIARLNKKRQHKAIRALRSISGSNSRPTRKHAKRHTTQSHTRGSTKNHTHSSAHHTASHTSPHHPSPIEVMNGFFGGGSGHRGSSGSKSSGHTSSSGGSGSSSSSGGSSSESGGGMSMPSMPDMPGMPGGF